MTVCIAAITSEGYIVTASDTMLSGVLGSTDVAAVKLTRLNDDWALMWSANDVSQLPPIIEDARSGLDGRDNTLKVVRRAVTTAFQNRLSELCADRVLGRFSMTMDEFKRSGKTAFTEQEFNLVCQEMRGISVGSELLVYGFDGEKKPHIFTVVDPGTDAVHDKAAYVAIGSGAYVAHGMLGFLGQTIDRSLYETAFIVCSSKFMAEKVSGVGRNTFFYVKQVGSISTMVSATFLDTIREEWEKAGAPRIPDGAIEKIKKSGIRLSNDPRDVVQ